MKIEQAIKILENLKLHFWGEMDFDEIDAVRLGVEALEWFQKARQYPFPIFTDKLLGED